MNQKQLAIKIMMNSTYGFLGAATGPIGHPELAAVVTAYGRKLIRGTADFILKTHPGSVIIGGDTDSVYFTLPHVSSLVSGFDEGLKIAKAVSQIYGHPIQLELEKLYSPMIYLKKKCYAAMMYESPTSTPCLDIKGIAIARGDTSPFTKALQLDVIKIIMKGTDDTWSNVTDLVNDAILSVKQTDPMLLIKSRKLGTDYKFPERQVQFQVAERMRLRGEEAPQVGEHVSWLVGLGTGGIASRADNPSFVTEIDYKYYIEAQIIKPMKRILEALNPDWKKYIKF